MTVADISYYHLSAGSFDQFLTRVKAIPLLTEAEEHDLAVRYRESGDLAAAERLVLSHLRYVVATARNFLGYGFPHADLVQEGTIGLMRAVKLFDPSHGVRLVSFAALHVKGAICDFIIRNWRIVKIATTKAQRKLLFNLSSLRKQIGFSDVDHTNQVASDLNIKSSEVDEMKSRLAGGDVSLYATSDDGETFDYLPDTSPTPEEVVVENNLEQCRSQALARAMSQLDDRCRDIVASRYMNETPLTLQDLSVKYGVSIERIRQLEVKSLKILRQELADYA